MRARVARCMVSRAQACRAVAASSKRGVLSGQGPHSAPLHRCACVGAARSMASKDGIGRHSASGPGTGSVRPWVRRGRSGDTGQSEGLATHVERKARPILLPRLPCKLGSLLSGAGPWEWGATSVVVNPSLFRSHPNPLHLKRLRRSVSFPSELMHTRCLSCRRV